jgi:hypothetical protein
MQLLDFGFLAKPTAATHIGLFDMQGELIAYGLLERPHGELLGHVTIALGNLLLRLTRGALV